MAEVHYDGSYVPLKGVEMSVAMASTLDISFDIRGGLFVRQMHHWAALLFVAAIGLHMLRIFFTGAFRKPREFNWIIGFTLFILAMGEGFTGYSLPDDLLSGNGLRIIDGLVKGMPDHRHLDLVPALRRRVPGHRDRRPPLHAAHPAAAGDHRRAHRDPPGARRRAQAHAVRRRRARPSRTRSARPSCRSTRRRPAASSSSSSASWRSSRRCSRSTRSGTTARTTPRRSRRARSPTGTSASPTAPCA